MSRGQTAGRGLFRLADTDPDQLASGEMVPDRRLAFAQNTTGSLVGSQSLNLHYFTARKTETINSIETYTGGTAAGATPTLCKVGIYSIAANGAGTLVASTANTTSLWATINTPYNTPLTAAWGKVAGQRYALALLIVTAAAVPIMVTAAAVATAVPDPVLSMAPRLCGRLAAQTDLPASFADASLLTQRHMYTARLVP